MARLGLDYSAGRIWGGTMRNAGFDFCIRYVDDPNVGLSSKHITPDEYKDLRDNGIDVWLVFEVGTQDWAGGYQAGVNYAHRARRGADWIGYPQGGVIFFCADMHLSGGQVPTALSYLDGAVSVLGHDAVGCYGFYEYVDAAIAQNKCGAYWQCGIRPDATDPVHVYQRNYGQTTVGGIECDVNELLRPIGGGTDDMALTDTYTDWAGNQQSIESTFNHLDQRLYELHEAILGAQQSRYTDPTGKRSDVRLNAIDAIFDDNGIDFMTRDTILAMKSEVDALKATVDSLVKAVAAVQGLDADAVASKVGAAVADALQKNTVHVDVEVSGNPAPAPASDAAPKS